MEIRIGDYVKLIGVPFYAPLLRGKQKGYIKQIKHQHELVQLQYESSLWSIDYKSFEVIPKEIYESPLYKIMNEVE